MDRLAQLKKLRDYSRSNAAGINWHAVRPDTDLIYAVANMLPEDNLPAYHPTMHHLISNLKTLQIVTDDAVDMDMLNYPSIMTFIIRNIDTLAEHTCTYRVMMDLCDIAKDVAGA